MSVCSFSGNPSFTPNESRFSGLAVIALLLGCGVAWYGWWLLIVWVVMLAALVGGRVMFIDHRPTRIFYLIAFAYLLAALLFWLVPQVVPDAALRPGRWIANSPGECPRSCW
ncbi:MAG: hypothetical protein V5B44_24430 [Candidatus Accumulibacter necessarius]|jgi:H+/Cl- antiporter ClcA|uniref:hypothetical protein n=1 Tax=Candidatus Accumulibacter necessarius TaxID=2954386 RepID=UPI002FC3476B